MQGLIQDLFADITAGLIDPQKYFVHFKICPCDLIDTIWVFFRCTGKSFVQNTDLRKTVSAAQRLSEIRRVFPESGIEKCHDPFLSAGKHSISTSHK